MSTILDVITESIEYPGDGQGSLAIHTLDRLFDAYLEDHIPEAKFGAAIRPWATESETVGGQEVYTHLRNILRTSTAEPEILARNQKRGAGRYPKRGTVTGGLETSTNAPVLDIARSADGDNAVEPFMPPDLDPDRHTLVFCGRISLAGQVAIIGYFDAYDGRGVHIYKDTGTGHIVFAYDGLTTKLETTDSHQNLWFWLLVSRSPEHGVQLWVNGAKVDQDEDAVQPAEILDYQLFSIGTGAGGFQGKFGYFLQVNDDLTDATDYPGLIDQFDDYFRARFPIGTDGATVPAPPPEPFGGTANFIGGEVAADRYAVEQMIAGFDADLTGYLPKTGDGSEVTVQPAYATVARPLENIFAETLELAALGADGGAANNALALKRAKDRVVSTGLPTRVIAPTTGSTGMTFAPLDVVVNTDEGAAIMITDPIAFTLKGAGRGQTIIKPATNKMGIISQNAFGSKVIVEGVSFEAPSVLQNVAPVNRALIDPMTGVVGVGPEINSAVQQFKGAETRLIGCDFKNFHNGVLYFGDWTDKLNVVGLVDIEDAYFDTCCVGLLAQSPHTIRMRNVRARNILSQVTDLGVKNAGHVIYVADRSGGYPHFVLIDGIIDEDSTAVTLKVRKGVQVSVANVLSNNTGGLGAFEHILGLTLSNMATKVRPDGETGIGDYKALLINDCGACDTSNIFMDIRGAGNNCYGLSMVDGATGLGEYRNKWNRIKDVTVVTDNAVAALSAVKIFDQSQLEIDNVKVINDSTNATSSYPIWLVNCSDVIVRDPYYRSGTATDSHKLLRTSGNCSRITLDYDSRVALNTASSSAPNSDDGTGTDIVVTNRRVDPTADTNVAASLVFSGLSQHIKALTSGATLFLDVDTGFRLSTMISGSLTEMMRATSNVITFGGPQNAEALRVTQVASAVNAVSVTGAVASGKPTITARGSDTNITLQLTGKGTGGVIVGAASGYVGFYNTTPVAKPAVTGSRGGNAALASLLTALASQGLITDSSSA